MRSASLCNKQHPLHVYNVYYTFRAMIPIFIFTAVDPERPEFSRVYEIAAQSTFAIFNTLILSDLHMPTFDITSFFIAGEDWTPGLEIPNPEFANITDVFDDEDTDSQEKVHMGNVRLCDLLAGEGSHLIYNYDILSDRALHITLTAVVEGDSASPEGRCLSGCGDAPEFTNDLVTQSDSDIKAILDDLRREDTGD